MNGWISIHRQILDCDIWDTDEPYDFRSAWVYLLITANHKDKEIVFNYKPMTVKRGQLLTSVRKLAEAWHWSKNRVLKYLRLLEELKMIDRDADNSRTLITIIKYDDFQPDRDTSGTEVCTQKGQRYATNNKDNKEKKEIIKASSRFSIINSQDYDFEELERKLDGHT